jgi:hypothetical protein
MRTHSGLSSRRTATFSGSEKGKTSLGNSITLRSSQRARFRSSGRLVAYFPRYRLRSELTADFVAPVIHPLIRPNRTANRCVVILGTTARSSDTSYCPTYCPTHQFAGACQSGSSQRSPELWSSARIERLANLVAPVIKRGDRPDRGSVRVNSSACRKDCGHDQLTHSSALTPR